MEFTSAAVLRLQNLFKEAQCGNEPEQVPGKLNRDGSREHPPKMATNMECFHAILGVMVDLVIIAEDEFGFKMGVALCKIAGGSLRRMANEVTPLLIDRFIYYAHPERRLKGYSPGASTWNSVAIKNYATVINEIFMKVPDTMDPSAGYADRMGDTLSLWLKDTTTIGGHMVNIRRVCGDTRTRIQWEKALDTEDGDSQSEDDSEEEEEARAGLAVRDSAPKKIGGLFLEEEQMCRMLLLLIACNPSNPFFNTQQIPQRIVGLLVDVGCFEKEGFWTSWVTKWLMEDGILGDSCPPQSVMLLFKLLTQLIIADPTLTGKGNLSKFRPWAFEQLQKFKHLFEENLPSIVESDPNLNGGMSGCGPNGARTMLATGYIAVLGAYCRKKEILMDKWTFYEFIPLLLRLRRLFYREGKDGMLLACIHRTIGSLLKRIDQVEEEIKDDRSEVLFDIQLKDPNEEVVDINTIRTRYDDWENLCYEINEIVDKNKEMRVLIKSAPVTRSFYLGKYMHVLSSSPDAKTKFDKDIVTICSVRWLLASHIFGMDSKAMITSKKGQKEQHLDPKLKAEEEMAKINRMSGAHQRTTCTFTPDIVPIFDLFSVESQLYQCLHDTAHAIENQRAQANLTRQRRRIQRGDGSMIEFEHAKKRIVQLMDAEIPTLNKQDYDIMLDILASTANLLSSFFDIAISHVDELQSSYPLSPYVEIARRLRLPHGGGRETNPSIEEVLFAMVENENDDVKLSAINCFSTMKNTRFEASAVKRMVNVLSTCADASAGQMEDVLVGVIKTLSHIGSLQNDFGQQFRMDYASELILGTMNIMKTMANLDPKDLSVAEVNEKKRLSHACVGFLIGTGKWEGDFVQEIFESDEAMQLTKAILKADERYGNLEHPVLIERTAAVGTVWTAMSYLAPPENTSYTNTRILQRVASILEGEAVANSFDELMRDSDTEEKIRRECQRKLEMHDDGHFDESIFFHSLNKMTHPAGPCPDLTKMVASDEVWHAGPWRSVNESKAHQDTRDAVYSEFDKDNSHFMLVESIFKYAIHNVSDPTFKTGPKEMTTARNQKLLHAFTQLDTCPSSEESLIKLLKEEAENHKEKMRLKYRSSSSESPRHLLIPSPAPAENCECQHHGRGASFPITIMHRPVICGGPLNRNSINPDALHSEGLDNTSKKHHVCSCWKGSAVAAVLRCLKALCCYSSPETKKQLWMKLSDPTEFAALCSLPYQFGFYQFNIGSTVLMVAYEFLRTTNLLRKGRDNLEKDEATLHHYMIVMALVQDIFSDLQARITTDIGKMGGIYTGSSDRERVYHDLIRDYVKAHAKNAGRGTSVTLSSRETQMLLQALKLYTLLSRQFPYLLLESQKASTEEDGAGGAERGGAEGVDIEDLDPSMALFLLMEREEVKRQAELDGLGVDDEEGEEMNHLTAQEEQKVEEQEERRKRRIIYKALFRDSDLIFFVQFYFYEERRRNAPFSLEKDQSGTNAVVMSLIVDAFGSRHSMLGPYEGGDILMLLHYMESAQGHDINKALIDDILRSSKNFTQVQHLTKWMQETGKCKDKFGEPDDEEFCLSQHLVTKYKDGVKSQVILILTNRAVHEFTKALLNKGGLTHSNITYFEQFACLSRNHSGQAVQLEFYLDSGKILRSKFVYLSADYGEIDFISKFIMARAPTKGRTRTVLWLDDLHLTYLLNEGKILEHTQGKEEIVEASFFFNSCILLGKTCSDVYIVVTSTRIHLLCARFEHWFQTGDVNKLPWWSDKSRYLPMPTGSRGWESQFLGPLLEPIKLIEIDCVKLLTNPKSRKAELIISMKGSAAKSGSGFAAMFGFGGDGLNEAYRLEHETYSNATYLHQVITLGMSKAEGA